MVQNNSKIFKVDLHTHSTLSYDGGITKKQYIRLLEDGILDCVAITDHNETGFAKALQNELGDKVIVGEEVKTLDGEVIGLFLNKTISPGLSAKETVNHIKNDGGLVYVPHPFETGRDSLQEHTLKMIIKDVDIIEVFNARGILWGKPKEAEKLAVSEKIAMASSSDAHCKMGVGSAFNVTRGLPKRDSLEKLLREGMLQRKYASLISLLCPGINKIKNKAVLGV